MQEYGERIKKYRKVKGITAKELAEYLNISPSFVSAIEHDSTKLSLKTLEKICFFFNISLSEFFSLNYEPIDQILINEIHSMKPLQKEALLNFIKTLHSDRKE